MKTTTHQTVVIPQGEEGAEFLRQLLTGGKTWAEAHAESPGSDIAIEESEGDDGHCGGCGNCSKCVARKPSDREAGRARLLARLEEIRRNRREDERGR